jgi:hypothetical protein
VKNPFGGDEKIQIELFDDKAITNNSHCGIKQSDLTTFGWCSCKQELYYHVMQWFCTF